MHSPGRERGPLVGCERAALSLPPLLRPMTISSMHAHVPGTFFEGPGWEFKPRLAMWDPAPYAHSLTNALRGASPALIFIKYLSFC